MSASVRNPERIVESGYDKIHQIYHELRAQRFWTNESEIRSFARRLPEGGMVLDAGSGSGFVASMLEKRGFRVTGIDLSRKMLRLARRNAPKSRFRRMNMRTLSFPADTFDGIICMYAIIHVPRRFHRGIIEGFHRTLKPMGILAIHMGWGDYVGTNKNYLGSGATMYWSHFNKKRNLAMLREAGFDVLISKRSKQKDGGVHLFAVARKV